MARTRLDQDHLGTEVGEDASRHRGGLAGEVDDTDPGQECFGHRHRTSMGSARPST
jgi:hypothetical protein